MTSLTLPTTPDLLVENAGLFVSRGVGKHPSRVLPSFELIFVRAGELAIVEDGRDVSVSAGQTLLLFPNRRHAGTAPFSKDLEFYWVHFRLADGFGRQERAKKGKSDAPMMLGQRSSPARPDRLAELFHRFLDDQDSDRLTPRTASLLVQLMLHEASTTSDPSPASAANVLAARVEAFIAAHMHEGLTTSRVAAALDMNPDYLTRAFKIARGQTITEFIHRRALREACSLLREGTASSKQVAARCGFADPSYFRRLFKRYEGMTPRAYRRLYARTHVNVT